jgi:hypothetical protein
MIRRQKYRNRHDRRRQARITDLCGICAVFIATLVTQSQGVTNRVHRAWRVEVVVRAEVAGRTGVALRTLRGVLRWQAA